MIDVSGRTGIKPGWLVVTYERYYPAGGMGDVRGWCETREEALGQVPSLAKGGTVCNSWEGAVEVWRLDGDGLTREAAVWCNGRGGVEEMT